MSVVVRVTPTIIVRPHAPLVAMNATLILAMVAIPLPLVQTSVLIVQPLGTARAPVTDMLLHPSLVVAGRSPLTIGVRDRQCAVYAFSCSWHFKVFERQGDSVP